jgi:hypothetical protein
VPFLWRRWLERSQRYQRSHNQVLIAVVSGEGVLPPLIFRSCCGVDGESGEKKWALRKQNPA